MEFSSRVMDRKMDSLEKWIKNGIAERPTTRDAWKDSVAPAVPRKERDAGDCSG